MSTTTSRITRVSLASILLLLAAFSASWVALPNWAAADGVSVSLLYPATKAAADAWFKTTSTARPAETTTFPARVKTVAFYFEYDGAVPNTSQFTIIVRDHTGTPVATHGPYILQHSDGLHMSTVDAPSTSGFVSGVYRVDLQISGSIMATTRFVVASVPTNGGGRRVAISLFHVTTAALASESAANDYSSPKMVNWFDSGTSVVSAYFTYRNVTAHSSTWQVIIYDQKTGAAYLTGAVRTFPYDWGTEIVNIDNNTAYDDGYYDIHLLINGHVAATGYFLVGNTIPDSTN